MKKFMSLILALCLLIGGNIHSSIAQNDFIDGLTDLNIASGITSLSYPNLLQYIEDTTYSSLAGAFSSDDYIIKEVNAITSLAHYFVTADGKDLLYEIVILNNAIDRNGSIWYCFLSISYLCPLNLLACSQRNGLFLNYNQQEHRTDGRD